MGKQADWQIGDITILVCSISLRERDSDELSKEQQTPWIGRGQVGDLSLVLPYITVVLPYWAPTVLVFLFGWWWTCLLYSSHSAWYEKYKKYSDIIIFVILKRHGAWLTFHASTMLFQRSVFDCFHPLLTYIYTAKKSINIFFIEKGKLVLIESKELSSSFACKCKCIHDPHQLFMM